MFWFTQGLTAKLFEKHTKRNKSRKRFTPERAISQDRSLLCRQAHSLNDTRSRPPFG